MKPNVPFSGSPIGRILSLTCAVLVTATLFAACSSRANPGLPVTGPVGTTGKVAFAPSEDETTSSVDATSLTDASETTTDFVPLPPETTETEPPAPQVWTQTEENLRTIPYTTRYEYSVLYYEGDRVVKTSGVDGQLLVTTVTTYTDGEVTAVDEYEQVLADPTDAVILIGTRATTAHGTVFTTEDEVPFATEYTYDDTRYDDEEFIVQEGKNGYTRKEYRLTFERGIEVSRKLISSTVMAPVSRIVSVGTMPATEEITITEKGDVIAYTTLYEYDATLPEGTQYTKTAGIDGYTESVYRITYYHGEESSRALVSRTVHEMQSEVIVIGTQKEETFGMPFLDAAHGGRDFPVTQYFGGSNNHGGIDFGVWYGSPIVAVKSGTVVYAYNAGDLPTSDLRWTYGTYIVVEHEGGVRTYYAHMSDRTVSVGDKVVKGQVLGHSGNTGRVSPAPTASNPLAGTHLHFEVRVWNGSSYVKTDPKAYLPYWN